VIAATLCAAPSAWAEPNLRLLSNVTWSQSDSWFGGFSGAEVSENGTRISLISDRGTLVMADMIRENGTLAAMQLRAQIPLAGAHGAALSNAESDPEGLAIDRQGRAFVSFEHDHRVARINLKTGHVTDGTKSPAFTKFELNSGLEALAVDPIGTLYTLPERSGGKRTPFPLFTFVNGAWLVAHHIPRRGPFMPVGADFSGDGLFYLLERAATPLGFRSRIRRFDLSADDLKEETLLTTSPGRYDNLEALSIWKNAAGQTFLTLISDDNFLAIQQTQIVEYELTE
jgi:hypothetical protein